MYIVQNTSIMLEIHSAKYMNLAKYKLCKNKYIIVLDTHCTFIMLNIHCAKYVHDATETLCKTVHHARYTLCTLPDTDCAKFPRSLVECLHNIHGTRPAKFLYLHMISSDGIDLII